MDISQCTANKTLNVLEHHILHTDE